MTSAESIYDELLTGDGGGRVPALARSLRGRHRVGRTLRNWARLGGPDPGRVNTARRGEQAPGALLLDGGGRLIGVWALDIAGNRIHGVRSIVNPDKLGHLGPVADLGTLLGSGPRRAGSR